MEEFISLSIKQFYVYLNTEIQYGFIDYNNVIYDEDEIENSLPWKTHYELQTDDRLSQTKIGHCWDFVELERFYFKWHAIPHTTYFMYDENIDEITHTFLTFVSEGKRYYLESSWYNNRGIYPVPDENELFQKLIKKQQEKTDLRFYIREYKDPEYPMNQFEFIGHCMRGMLIAEG